MNPTKTAVVIGTMIILIAGTMMTVKWKRARTAALETTQAAKTTEAVGQIKEVNSSLPDLQVQAKTLIFTAMIQKQIPLSATWCETLNVGGNIWPITPTNTVFAINSRVAGRPYSKTNRLNGDVVVFFETSNPGWNLAGGSELLASGSGNVAVALADGRAMTMTLAEAANLRWTP